MFKLEFFMSALIAFVAPVAYAEGSSTTALSPKQVSKDTGKSANAPCDASEVLRRSIRLSVDFQRASKSGAFTPERQQEFSKDSQETNQLATSDPERACKELAGLRKKYGLASSGTP